MAPGIMPHSSAALWILGIMSSVVTSAAAAGAANQAGVLEGMNPSNYNANNPLTLFIIQVGFPVFLLRDSMKLTVFLSNRLL